MIKNVYIGNIMETQCVNTDSGHNKTKLVIKKQSAVLYKTKTGAYVDLDEAKEKSRFLRWNLKKADKIDVGGNDKVFGNDIMVMPAIPISDIYTFDGTGSFNIFVDEESLVPYSVLVEKEKRTKGFIF